MMNKRFVFFIFAALFVISTFVIITKPVNAINYDTSNIIDDSVFTNESSMTEAQIQSFINQFPGSCLLSQNYPSGISTASFKAPIDYWTYSTSDSSPAHIIYWAANYYHLNPQVILTTLEKEENLVTGNQGCSQSRYNSAMGYNCPDNLTLHDYADIGIFNTCVVRESNAGFARQVSHATWQLRFDEERAYGNVDWGGDGSVTYSGRMTQGYRARVSGGSLAYYDGYTTIDGVAVYISNGSTAALYNYTPHFNSFYSIFTSWFGSTYSNIYQGVNYSAVFDAVYYLNKYPDLKSAFGNNVQAAIAHFVNYGMNEGRQASSSFDVISYKNRYQDLRISFGSNLTAYYLHYITNGKAEGRIATGNSPIQYITTYNGIDYSSVYNFTTYTANNADMQQKFSDDDAGAIRHFVTQGMSEGRQASNEFNVTSYQSLYYDLRRVFSSNLKAYYMHYVTNGKAEGRSATGSYLGGTTVLNGIDYKSVYNINDYETNNSDIKNSFGLNDIAALQHFVYYGMSEGRQASPSTFNVFVYKARYTDLQVVFGNNLKAYYMHYITNGKAEGRTGI